MQTKKARGVYFKKKGKARVVIYYTRPTTIAKEKRMRELKERGKGEVL